MLDLRGKFIISALTLFSFIGLADANMICKLGVDKNILNKATGKAPVVMKDCTIERFKGKNCLRMTDKSILGFPLKKPLKNGTVFITIVPDKSWFDGGSKTPRMIFQIGAHHWGANNISLFREANGKLVVRFHNGKNQQSFYTMPIGDWQAGRVYKIALSWNNERARVYINGKERGGISKPKIPDKFPSLFFIGSPSDAHYAGWSLNGLILEAAVYDNAMSPDKLMETTLIGGIKKKTKVAAIKPRAIVDSDEPYIKATDKIVHIGTGTIEMQITTDGRPVALYDKIASRFIIENWTNGRFWTIFDQNRKNLRVSNTDAKADFNIISKGSNRYAHWRYDGGVGKCVIDIYIRPDIDGSLRFKYAITNNYSDKLSYFYFPYFAGISKKDGGWAMVPRLNGILHKFENFRNMEYGGPGQLSTMLIGVKAGPSTLLLYPDDVKGALQFAIAANDGANSIFIVWDDKGITFPKTRYESPFAFRLYNVGDTGLKGIAEQYRRWAKKQSWFVTWQDKVKATPVLKKIANGVIKMTGFEALSGRGYKSYAWKEQHKGLTFNYDNFLKVAEYIETTYKVKPCYRYDGWYARFDSRYPQYFPVDKRLGNFKAFMDANNKAGRLVYLHTNPIQWDFDADMFDINKMSQPYPGHYSLSSWSHNRLYFGSPRLILDDEVKVVKKIISYGVRGLFEDVIGCTTMADTNPLAGYKDEGRAGGTQALLELASALRKASPGVFRGTEAGAERMLPYYDGFLFGSGNDDFVPFFKMVYGDCFVNMQPIDGGGSGDNFHMIARHLLFGVVLGLDGRGGRSKWSRGIFSPLAQKVFEMQNVAKHTIGKRILNYTWKGTVYLSEWDDCITVANLGRLPVDKIEFDTTIGKVNVSGMSPDSVVFIRKDGQFVAIHCRKMSIDGKEIFNISKNAIAVYNGKDLKKIEYVKRSK